MIGLATERLTFRQWQTSDYPAIAEFYANKENAHFVGGIKPPEDAWRLMASYIGHYVLHGYSYLAIETKKNQELIGTVGLWNSQPWPEPELGYWLIPEAQGKGYAQEAGLAVKAYALDELNLDTLVSYIDPSNEPSKKLALTIGARLDGQIELLEFGNHEIYRYR